MVLRCSVRIDFPSSWIWVRVVGSSCKCRGVGDRTSTLATVVIGPIVLARLRGRYLLHHYTTPRKTTTHPHKPPRAPQIEPRALAFDDLFLESKRGTGTAFNAS